MSLKKYVGDEASEAVITIHLYNGFSASSVSVPVYQDQFHPEIKGFHPRSDVYGNNFIKIRTVITKDGHKSFNTSAEERKRICTYLSIDFYLNYGC